MTAAFRQANPLCVQCLAEGRTTLATVVDHTIPHKGNWELYADPSNWAAMCASCHSRKTATRDGGFGHRRGGEHFSPEVEAANHTPTACEFPRNWVKGGLVPQELK